MLTACNDHAWAENCPYAILKASYGLCSDSTCSWCANFEKSTAKGACSVPKCESSPSRYCAFSFHGCLSAGIGRPIGSCLTRSNFSIASAPSWSLAWPCSRSCYSVSGRSGGSHRHASSLGCLDSDFFGWLECYLACSGLCFSNWSQAWARAWSQDWHPDAIEATCCFHRQAAERPCLYQTPGRSSKAYASIWQCKSLLCRLARSHPSSALDSWCLSSRSACCWRRCSEACESSCWDETLYHSQKHCLNFSQACPSSS